MHRSLALKQTLQPSNDYVIQLQQSGIEPREHSSQMEAVRAEKVGFIGHGNIGNPTSGCVLGAGFSLCGLDPAKMVAAINASSGMRFATMKRIPNFVLKADYSFRGGMATGLSIKDLTTALS
jgi:phosphoglycerate dehydrogenase-like enzyme